MFYALRNNEGEIAYIADFADLREDGMSSLTVTVEYMLMFGSSEMNNIFITTPERWAQLLELYRQVREFMSKRGARQSQLPLFPITDGKTTYQLEYGDDNFPTVSLEEIETYTLVPISIG